jgi:hypothetical protein
MRPCRLGGFWAAVLGLSAIAAACPICGQPTITLAERFARADAALLVEWVSAKGAEGQTPESTIYEIVQVQRDPLGTHKAGAQISVERYVQGKTGNLYLLLGRKDDKRGIKWDDSPLAVSETSFQYVVQAPSPEAPAEKRLGYFLKFLEFPDLTIANDAFAQFVNAPTKDIAAVAGSLPKDKLRRWLADPKTPVTRQAGYGLMLGLCGGSDDARFLEQRIAAIDPERQFGVEGLMFGYLMIAGDAGLARLEKMYLADPKTADGQAYAAIQAIRYYWSYGNGKIAEGRLQASMRLMLDRPAFAENAIKDLARWKDWSLHDRLMRLYRSADDADKPMKKAIVGYMIASTRDVQRDSKELPPHVVAGRECLETLRERDPKLVAEAEKFFFLPQ